VEHVIWWLGEKLKLPLQNQIQKGSSLCGMLLKAICVVLKHIQLTHTHIYGYCFSRLVACCGPDVICKPIDSLHKKNDDKSADQA
jgi:hypothetical protein